MSTPKKVLNELKWREDFDLNKAEIYYVHRGAPNDTMIIKGSEILELQHSFMKTKSAMIPFHRIFRIIYEGKIVFDKMEVIRKSKK